MAPSGDFQCPLIKLYLVIVGYLTGDAFLQSHTFIEIYYTNILFFMQLFTVRFLSFNLFFFCKEIFILTISGTHLSALFKVEAV